MASEIQHAVATEELRVKQAQCISLLANTNKLKHTGIAQLLKHLLRVHLSRNLIKIRLNAPHVVGLCGVQRIVQHFQRDGKLLGYGVLFQSVHE